MDLQRKRNGHNAEPHNILYSSAAKGLLQRVTWPWLGVACWSDKPSDTSPGSYFGNCHSHIGMVTTAMQITSPKPTFVKSANW